MAVSEVRKRRLRALSRLHTAFVADNLDAPFDPAARPGSGDYNVHHVDLESTAEPAFAAEALAIVRGDRDDQLTWPTS